MRPLHMLTTTVGAALDDFKLQCLLMTSGVLATLQKVLPMLSSRGLLPVFGLPASLSIVTCPIAAGTVVRRRPMEKG